MAVYTTLTETEIRNLLARFELPDLVSFQGATSGIENTTYFLTLRSGSQYVLTVFENFSAGLLAPYIKLMTHLYQQHLSVPRPLIDREGATLQTIAHKPALLFARAPGEHIELLTPSICHQVGNMLARIHQAVPDPGAFSFVQLYGSAWMQETFMLVRNSLVKADIKLMEQQLDLSTNLEKRQLPQGMIHGDLFRDNVLVQGDRITAVIDFYNAGQDILLIDLAITANDWCFSQKDPERYVSALFDGYQAVRPLKGVELAAWPECLQIAATRLWLSRQKRVFLSQQGYNRTIKDPGEYRSLLLYHLNTSKPAFK